MDIKQLKPLKKGKNPLRRVPLFLILVVIVIIFSILMGFLITYWLDHNIIRTQSPIVLRTPVWVEVKEDPQLAVMRKQMQDLENRLNVSEASYSAVPKDVPVIQKFMRPQTDASVIQKQKHSVILWLVYGLESTWGKQDICKSKGMVNGFGFGQPDSSLVDGSYKCYSSLDEVAQAVNDWFDKSLAQRSLSESLCGYNKGFNGEGFTNCMAMNPKAPYLKNFINLAYK